MYAVTHFTEQKTRELSERIEIKRDFLDILVELRVLQVVDVCRVIDENKPFSRIHALITVLHGLDGSPPVVSLGERESSEQERAWMRDVFAVQRRIEAEEQQVRCAEMNLKTTKEHISMLRRRETGTRDRVKLAQQSMIEEQHHINSIRLKLSKMKKREAKMIKSGPSEEARRQLQQLERELAINCTSCGKLKQEIEQQRNIKLRVEQLEQDKAELKSMIFSGPSEEVSLLRQQLQRDLEINCKTCMKREEDNEQFQLRVDELEQENAELKTMIRKKDTLMHTLDESRQELEEDAEAEGHLASMQSDDTTVAGGFDLQEVRKQLGLPRNGLHGASRVVVAQEWRAKYDNFISERTEQLPGPIVYVKLTQMSVSDIATLDKCVHDMYQSIFGGSAVYSWKEQHDDLRVMGASVDAAQHIQVVVYYSGTSLLCFLQLEASLEAALQHVLDLKNVAGRVCRARRNRRTGGQLNLNERVDQLRSAETKAGSKHVYVQLR